VKQLLPRVQTLVSFGSGLTEFPVTGSPTGVSSPWNRTPVPWACTFRNLVMTSGDTRALPHAQTLLKNYATTALTATLESSSDGPEKNTTDDVVFAQFDDCMWEFATDAGPESGGKVVGWCVEIDSPGNIFGIPCNSTGSCPVNIGAIGGALGNGFWASYDNSSPLGPTQFSTSYSICATPGSVTRLVLKTLATPPTTGASWRGYMRLNGVVQDGSGSTVNTLCEITAGNTTAAATFDLPIVPGDIVEVLYYRTGVDHPFELAGQVGVGIGFIPTNAGYFMLTGGSNTTLGAPGYVWTNATSATESIVRAPVGQGGFSARGLYIRAPQPGVSPDDEVTRWLRKNGVNTSISIVLSYTQTSGSSLNKNVRYIEDDFIDILQLSTGGSSPDSSSLYWGLEVGPLTDTAEDGGVIGPLAWVHIRRRVPNTSPAEFITETYTDYPGGMNCPSTWENGRKEDMVAHFGDMVRAASHPFTGDWQGATCPFEMIDRQHVLRAQHASEADRYWLEATVRMTTRANRAIEGVPFTVFTGPFVDGQPSERGRWAFTLGDVVSHGMLSDEAQQPWRQIKDGFLQQIVAISENLDRETPEPIIYGRHVRDAEETSSPETDEGIRIVPTYVGIDLIEGIQYHVWLVAGHACKSVQLYLDGVLRPEGADIPIIGPSWLIPGQPAWEARFGAPYRDYVSDTYPDQTRRYTLIYGNFGRETPEAVISGESEMTVAVEGIESEGDGSGELITDRFQQYEHFLINYVANQGSGSYMSGSWLSNPTWDLFDGSIEKVDEDSFDTASGIGLMRLSDGYVGAAIIGAQPGDRASVKKWIADWNRSCGCRFGVNHRGQLHVWLLHPTDTIKAAAPLYTDAYEILEDRFRTEILWDQHATAISYNADFNHVTGAWVTTGVVEDEDASDNYGRTIPSEPREYPFAPGELQAEHLATLELRIRKHRPRYIRLEATVGHDPVTLDSLGYRDQGDYIRYVHFDAVQETREERLAQVIDPGVRIGARVISVVAMDCEDLIDFDVDSSPGGSP
jgi:hypothetical protein